jgi:hypothetical protein
MPPLPLPFARCGSPVRRRRTPRPGSSAAAPRRRRVADVYVNVSLVVDVHTPRGLDDERRGAGVLHDLGHHKGGAVTRQVDDRSRLQ